jgi:hypothetical protein
MQEMEQMKRHGKVNVAKMEQTKNMNVAAMEQLKRKAYIRVRGGECSKIEQMKGMYVQRIVLDDEYRETDQ